MDLMGAFALLAGLFLVLFGICFNDVSFSWSTLFNFYSISSMAITFGGTIAATMLSYPASYFDAVTCTAVWMNWFSHEDCVQNLETIRRHLREDGFAFFAVTNPEWVEIHPEYEIRLDRRLRSVPGISYEVVRRGNLHKGVDPTKNCNWPLEVAVRQLKEA